MRGLCDRDRKTAYLTNRNRDASAFELSYLLPTFFEGADGDAKWAGEIILPPAFFNYIIIHLTTSFKKNDVVNIDNEYNECYYLNASLYPLMSKLMFK